MVQKTLSIAELEKILIGEFQSIPGFPVTAECSVFKTTPFLDGRNWGVNVSYVGGTDADQFQTQVAELVALNAEQYVLI